MGLVNWLERTFSLDSDIKEVKAIFSDLPDKLSIKILAYHIATSYIANTIGKCEFKRYVGGKEIKDKLYYLLNVKPNINENASKFKNKLIFRLFEDGEVLVFENKGHLHVADSYLREPNPLNGDRFTNIKLDDETRTFTRKASDVFYFNLDDGKLKTLWESMMTDFSEVMKYAFEVFKSSNSEKYKLVMDEVKAGDKDFEEKFNTIVKTQLKDFIDNPRSVYLQFKGYNLEKISTPVGKTDSTDIINLKKDVFETTAQAFKMPVSMLYGNMTNVKDIISSYITFAIDPLATMIGEELTGKTGTEEDFLNGNKIVVDTTSIMHIDIFEIADKIDKLVASSMYNTDELRTKVGDAPTNSEFGKQHWITKNYAKVEDALTGEIDMKGGE